MKQQVNQVFHSLWNSARDLPPVVLVIAFFQIFVLQKPIPNMGQLFVGTLLVVIGLSLFKNFSLSRAPVIEFGKMVGIASFTDMVLRGMTTE